MGSALLSQMGGGVPIFQPHPCEEEHFKTGPHLWGLCSDQQPSSRGGVGVLGLRSGEKVKLFVTQVSGRRAGRGRRRRVFSPRLTKILGLQNWSPSSKEVDTHLATPSGSALGSRGPRTSRGSRSS